MRAKWGTPSDGGPDTPLTGFGLLFWEKDNPVHPGYDDPLVLGPNERMYTYENLQPDTTYNFQIHACNGPDSCGYWTVPIVEVKTAGPPKKPHTISVDEKKGTSARVNWRPEADTGGPDVSLTGFGIRWREEGDDWPSQAQGVVNRNKRSHVMSGLTKNTTYEVSLQSCNGDNSCSAWTSPLEFRTPGMLPAPPAPTNLAAGTATRTSVPLTWDALTGAAKYRVENRPGDSGAWTEHDDDIGGTSHTVDGLSCGTSHQFRVTAYGNGTTYAAAWGTASAVLTASTSASGCTVPSPPAPTNLAAGTVTDRSVPLSWNAVANATKYRVEYRVSGTTAWTTDDETLTTLMHTVDELSCGTAYEFGVSAYGDGTNHLAQWGTRATTSATTGGCVPGMISVPGPVTGVRFPEADLSDTSFKVTWTAPSSNGGAAITKYEVNWVAGQTNETASVTGPSGSSPPTATTIDTDVKPATAYVVKVRACNGPSRCSPWPTNGRVVTTRPSQVQDLDVQAGDGQLTVSWSALESNLGNLAATRSATRSDSRFLNPSARLFYQAQYREANVGSWPADDEYSAGSITTLRRTSFSGLANGVRFLVRSRGLIDLSGLGPELQLPVRLAGAWSATKSGRPARKTLATPTGLNARPLPDRRIRLGWNSVGNADRYIVNKMIRDTATEIARVERTSLEVDIEDELIQGTTVGFTVTAHDTDNSEDRYSDSEPTGTVYVINNPILRINGNSQGAADNMGVARVRWTEILLATSYTLYYRIILASDHSAHSAELSDQPPWKPTSPYLYHDGQGAPWESIVLSPDDFPYSDEELVDHAPRILEYPITGLRRYQIYGVFLTYTTGTSEYASASEAYVWPSDRVADNGERVATIPLRRKLAMREFRYSVCFYLFPDEQSSVYSSDHIDNVKASWVNLVKAAFKQWEIATHGLIAMTFDGSPCGNYDRTVMDILEGFDGDFGSSDDIEAFLSTLDYYSSVFDTDQTTSEVRVVNHSHPQIASLIRVGAMPQINKYIGIHGCTLKPGDRTACAKPSGSHDEKGELTDINIPGGPGNPHPSVTAGVRYNACLDDDMDIDDRFTLLVHEAGPRTWRQRREDRYRFDVGR